VTERPSSRDTPSASRRHERAPGRQLQPTVRQQEGWESWNALKGDAQIERSLLTEADCSRRRFSAPQLSCSLEQIWAPRWHQRRPRPCRPTHPAVHLSQPSLPEGHRRLSPSSVWGQGAWSAAKQLSRGRIRSHWAPDASCILRLPSLLARVL